MQQSMQYSLPIQFAFFLTNILQIVQPRPGILGAQDPKLLEHRGSPFLVSQHSTPPAVLDQIRFYLVIKKTAERSGKGLIDQIGRAHV